ncbi:FtsQ-type POTRA domain-containing protein [Bacillus tianshenii]|nr:FtsQ-type POTRA domain-containing protein [Bacillus tianshenii]
MEKGKIVSLEDRIPKLKEQRKKKANRRFIFYIVFFFVMIAAIVYVQSPLSKVSSLEVSGNRYISSEEIITLSGLSKQDNIWKVDEEETARKIEKHPEIKSVTVDKHFINTVEFLVEENARTAYLLREGKFHPILETGKILPALDSADVPVAAPVLMNWEPSEALQEMAAELRKVPPSIMNNIAEIHHTPMKSDQLHVTLFMNDGQEVSITVRNFAEKITAYPAIASRLKPEQKGVIHLEVGAYFKEYKNDEKKEKEEGEADNEA